MHVVYLFYTSKWQLLMAVYRWGVIRCISVCMLCIRFAGPYITVYTGDYQMDTRLHVIYSSRRVKWLYTRGVIGRIFVCICYVFIEREYMTVFMGGYQTESDGYVYRNRTFSFQTSKSLFPFGIRRRIRVCMLCTRFTSVHGSRYMHITWAVLVGYDSGCNLSVVDI